MLNIDQKVLEKVSKSFQIPSKPEILIELQKITQSPEPAIADAANLIGKDLGLAAAVLKIINSPMYGMSRTISDIHQASFLLGLSSIETLVTGFALKNAFNGEACISLERFWDSAIDVAQTMMHIGKRISDKVPLENLYTLGLFHDCGISAMAIKYPDYVDVLQESNNNPGTILTHLEEQRYQTNHSVVGYYIASSWHLPKPLCQLILRHHETDALESLDTKEDVISMAVLKLADNVVNVVRRHGDLSEWAFFEDSTLDTLGFSDQEYQDLIEDLSDQMG